MIRQTLEQFAKEGYAPESHAQLFDDSELMKAEQELLLAEDLMLSRSNFIQSKHVELTHAIRENQDKQIILALEKLSGDPLEQFKLAINSCAVRHRIEYFCNSFKLRSGKQEACIDHGFIFCMFDAKEILLIGSTTGNLFDAVQSIGLENVSIVSLHIEASSATCKAAVWLRAIEKFLNQFCNPKWTLQNVKRISGAESREKD